jgi:membrane protein DedA with SNARE-associated domain
MEYGLLALGAGLEYIVPPVPGDLVVLLGAFLVGRHAWSATLVWSAVLMGSVIGLSVDYAFGVWVAHRDSRWRQRYPWWGRLGPSIDRFDQFYRKWGALCIVANRFVPALRAMFFVAAGMAGIRYWKVLVLGLVSAVLWNLLLFSAGLSVGYNWSRLRSLLGTYSRLAWGAAIVAILVALVVFLYRRRRARRQDDGSPRTS